MPDAKTMSDKSKLSAKNRGIDLPLSDDPNRRQEVPAEEVLLRGVDPALVTQDLVVAITRREHRFFSLTNCKLLGRRAPSRTLRISAYPGHF